MFEEIYQKIARIKKNCWLTFLGVITINSIFVFMLIYLLINQQKITSLIVTWVFVFIGCIIFDIIINVKNSKKVNQLVNTEIIPYQLRHVNPEYIITNDVFKKEEAVRSLIVSRYGSFQSSNIVSGVVNQIPVRYGYISNIISTGQTAYYVFAGTYISFDMNHSVSGFVQIRDKGKAEKNKKQGIEMHRYKGKMAERFSDILFYTSSDFLAEKYFDEKLITLYCELKKEFKKGFYLSISDKKIVIGINNRKNLFRYSLFKKINQELFDVQMKEFRKIDHIINETTKFINENYFD